MNKTLINNFKKFFELPEVKKAIGFKDFEKLYNLAYKFNSNLIPEITKMLYNIGSDPLPYMEKVPIYFLLGQEEVSQINIPTNIKSIGIKSFAGTSIINLTVPEGVEIIEGHAFEYCNLLENIKLPSTLNDIGLNVFYGCSNLRSIEYAGIKNNFQTLFSDAIDLGDKTLNYKTIIACQDGKMRYRKKTNEWVDVK